jgi:hypothetical protein
VKPYARRQLKTRKLRIARRLEQAERTATSRPELAASNIACKMLAGGARLEHLELLRNDKGYRNALGASRIPDPATAGDFCRRFDEHHIESPQEVFNAIRVKV